MIQLGLPEIFLKLSSKLCLVNLMRYLNKNYIRVFSIINGLDFAQALYDIIPLTWSFNNTNRGIGSDERGMVVLGGISSYFSYFNEFSQISQSYGISPETAIVVIIVVAALLLCFVLMPLMFCCTRQKPPGSPYSKRDLMCKKGLFALMLARLDEFDTLTPLLLTPGPSQNNSDESEESTSPTVSRPTRVQIESDSPPPPRRPHIGKTLIVPLNASRYRTPFAPALGTPDSRVTSFECGTSKSCATIPEDNEDISDSCDRIDDLVSIDRTSISQSEQKSHSQFRYYHYPSAYNLIQPQKPPEYQLPVPSYSAPEIPRPEFLAPDVVIIRNTHSDDSSIGSANSSLATGSPPETTGSITDSFYINSDIISSTNGSQVMDAVLGNDAEVVSKYYLHRIEEESEAGDDSRRMEVDMQHNIIPRSISEQFELLRRAQ